MGTEIAQIKMAHLSDLHFGPPFVPRVGEAILKHLEQWQPDVIVITGDLTQRARFSQFLAAKTFFSRFPAKSELVVIPGNHDIPLYRFWERLFTPYRLFRTLISEERNVHFKTEGLGVVGIDTTHPLRRLKGGRVSRAELDRCEETFEALAASACRVVAFHHPVFFEEGILDPGHWVIRRLKEMGADLVLCGHVHQSSIDYLPPSGEEKGLGVVLCGTSSSSRGRREESGGNSLNEIAIGPGHVSIVRRVYEKTDSRFVEVEQKRLQR